MKKTTLRHKPDAHLLPTLFDRLCDDMPTQLTEHPDAYVIHRKKMLAIIKRDLSYLLNTVNMDDIFDKTAYEAIRYSTINYGIPALSGNYLSTHQWRHIERCIRQAILHFEPRLIPEALRIIPHLNTDKSHHYNILSFEIHGLIYMTPYPMEFLMQSAIDLENNRLSVNQ